MLTKLMGMTLQGVDAYPVTIEVNVSNGLGYHITGLPDDMIRESLSRIEVAIKSNGYHMPRIKVIINLAPADLRKTGTAFDLPIAIGILMSSQQLPDPMRLQDHILVGELGLDGSVYPVRGALCMAWQAKQERVKSILLPAANAGEAALVEGLSVYGIRHLQEAIDFLSGIKRFSPVTRTKQRPPAMEPSLDFKEVYGQPGAKRALEIAAAGGHNALMVGPPGIGKTMLAQRLPSILPPMSLQESIETTRIYSVLNQAEPLTGLIVQRPFRNPHHTATDVALIGGGAIPMPGEITLAHNGVLFLDELPEFRRSAIEVLRQPLEQRKVLIARSRVSLEYPASFMLLAAMNPCCCGYYGHPTRDCTCSKRALYWYRRRVSGPLMERMDLHVPIEAVPFSEWDGKETSEETSSRIQERVIIARTRQTARYQGLPGVHANAHLSDKDLSTFCELEEAARRHLLKTMEKWQLSARSYTRVLKVARTIADLVGASIIELHHIAEALHYRSLDRPLNILTRRENS